MKQKVNLVSQILAVVFFTLMVVIDFFPDIGIGIPSVATGVVIFVVIAVVTRHRDVPVFNSSKQELIFTFFTGIYIFSLLFVLSLFGGVSQVGIELTNPILWGLYLLGLLFSYLKYKKELKQMNKDDPKFFSKS